MHVSLVIAAAVTQPPLVLDLSAVFLGGLSGAIFAVQRKFVITGVLAIAIATGLGGGIVRDLLVTAKPVALTNPRYLPVCVAAAVIGFFFASAVHRWRLMLDILDPIWMGLFAVIGAQKALNVGYNGWGAVLVGCVTAFGGALLRDLLAGEKPQLVLPVRSTTWRRSSAACSTSCSSTRSTSAGRPPRSPRSARCSPSACSPCDTASRRLSPSTSRNGCRRRGAGDRGAVSRAQTHDARRGEKT